MTLLPHNCLCPTHQLTAGFRGADAGGPATNVFRLIGSGFISSKRIFLVLQRERTKREDKCLLIRAGREFK